MENEMITKAKQKIEDAFKQIKDVEIKKTQHSLNGRRIFVPVLMALSTALFIFCICFTMFVTFELKYFLLVPLESLIYAVAMARFVLMLVVDVKTQNRAESIRILKDDNGQMFYYSKGNYTEKLEYDEVKVSVNGENYDKFNDKTKLSPLAGRYEKNLQRRSSNKSVLSASYLLGLLGDMSVAVTETEISGLGVHGEIKIMFDMQNGTIRKIIFYGKEDGFYDSGSPISFLDTKLMGKYTYIYEFEYYGENREPLKVPLKFKSALTDFMLPLPKSEKVEFI